MPQPIQIDPDIAFVPSLNSVFAFWRQHNYNQSLRGISGQRITLTGERLWGNYGKTFIPMQGGDQWDFIASITEQQPVLTFLLQLPVGSTVHVRSIRVDADGNTVWFGGQSNVSLVQSNKLHIAGTGFVNGQMIIAWEDQRNDGGDVYAQNLKSNGTIGPLSPFLNVNPQVLIFETAEHFLNGRNFVVKNSFPAPQLITNMTTNGSINPSNSYNWIVEPDLSNNFPVTIQSGDSLVFNVSFLVPTNNRTWLYDTIRIWSGSEEYQVIIQMNPAGFPSSADLQAKPPMVQVFPNPFNSTATFHLDIGLVFNQLRILNSVGETIRMTTIDATTGYRFVWDGTDDQGGLLPDGLYLCKFIGPTNLYFLKLVKISAK